MKHRLVFGLIALMLSLSVSAQSSGYSGKRLVIKADVVEGKYAYMSGFSLEGIINRNFTLSVGYKGFDSQVKQHYREYEYSGNSVTFGGQPLSLSEKADVNTKAFEIEGRYYNNSRWKLPAPNGMFFHLNVRWGQISVDHGQYFLELLDPTNIYPNPVKDEIIDYSYQNINFTTFELGGGYQKLLFGWVTLGGKLGFNYTSLSVDNKGYTEQVISGVAKYTGNNLVTLIHKGKTNTSPDAGNIGVSLTLQIGILIY